MGNRAEDWLDQAKDDFRWGTASAESGFYSQCCFIAQQEATGFWASVKASLRELPLVTARA
jgi:HEPN domain-containing protein